MHVTFINRHMHKGYFLFTIKKNITTKEKECKTPSIVVFKVLQENYNRITRSETASGKATKWAT